MKPARRPFTDRPTTRVLSDADSSYLPAVEPEGDLRPEDIAEALAAAREWSRKSLFLTSGLGLKAMVLNYGLRLRAKVGATAAQKQAFEKWQQQYGPSARAFIKEQIEDYLLMDNAVAFWRKSPEGLIWPRITSLPPENCEYTDPLGVERLKVQLRWKPEELQPKGKEKLNITKALADRYTKHGKIELSEAEGEFFRVLKRGRVGWGFGWPRIYSLFRTLRQNESLEVADNLWAHRARAIITHYKIGHEIKQGPKAGQSLWFWTAKRGKAVRDFFENRFGELHFTSNFDVEIEHPFPSVDRWDAKKYQSAWQRMLQWLGPIGLMLQAKGPNDFLLRLAKAWAAEDREDVKGHCEAVINQVFPPGVPWEIVWSNRLFYDQRMSTELVKFLLTAGPLSQRSALVEADFDPAEEREHKAEEGALVKNPATAPQVLPIFDPSHGNRPGKDGGRPAGQKDGAPRDKAEG